MNNVTSVALRTAGLCSKSSLWPQPQQLLKRAFHSFNTSNGSVRQVRPQWRTPSSKFSLTSPSSIGRTSSAKSTQKRCLHATAVLHKLKPYPEDVEPGLSFRNIPLSQKELNEIFGPQRPGDEILNRLLKVLHARRLDGTLDIPLDEHLSDELERRAELGDAGLTWLRTRYPVDEEAAIHARFKREEAPREQENPSALMQRGQSLGLFKTQDESIQEDPDYYGPQSGAYYAQLAEKQDDVFGRSEFDRIRAENEAKAVEEERLMQDRIDKSMKEAEAKAKEKSQAVIHRPDQNIELSDGKQIRPPNTFEQWVIKARDRAQSNLTLESPEVKNMSTAQRIAPSLFFVLACLAGLYYFTEFWEPPRRNDRLFPNTSLAMATCGTILAANVLVFYLWRLPPALRLLNKYFIVVPAYPYAFSMLGNIFSQHSFKHLAMNMLGLFLFGPSLHEDVGRANFLAIYLASGLLGSLFSLSSFALRGIMTTSSNGSSGCVWGIMSAYFWLHKDQDFTFIFLPRDLQDQFSVKGWGMLAAFAFFDAISAMRVATIDIAAHMTGLAVGILATSFWKAQHGSAKRDNRPVLLTGKKD